MISDVAYHFKLLGESVYNREFYPIDEHKATALQLKSLNKGTSITNQI